MHDIEEIIADIQQGKLVIIVDDEDRENEGDLVMAAEKLTAEHVNFMITHGRGLFCMPISQQLMQQLNLSMMTSDNKSRFHTNFTVSIEAAAGVTTGISAKERAHTVLTAIADGATADNIVSPGHIFPIVACEGGVLKRPGHTEATVDLARLAGFKPAGVLIEILNADGTMARVADLEKFAAQHQLKMGCIADLIAYRETNHV